MPGELKAIEVRNYWANSDKPKIIHRIPQPWRGNRRKVNFEAYQYELQRDKSTLFIDRRRPIGIDGRNL
jgi:hypothetical protein